RLQHTLRDVMWERVGLVREGTGLREARDEITRIEQCLAETRVGGGRAFNLAWQDWLNLENQLLIARLIATSAEEPPERRGAHFRRDFPAMDPKPPYVVRVQRVGETDLVWREPVALTRIQPTASSVSAPVETGD